MADLGAYDTKLTPEEEKQYESWAKATKRTGDTEDYDLRGAWKAGVRPAPNGHLPDTYKKPNHPTFSNESKYSKGDAGSWIPGPNGTWTFKAGPANLKSRNADQLKEYFQRVEPGNKLELPDQPNQTDQQLINSVKDTVGMGKSKDPAPSTPIDSPKPASSSGLGLEHMSFMDGLLFALTGTPRQLQTPEDQAVGVKHSKEAAKESANFANAGGDAADSYMGAPGTGGGGFNLSDVIKLVGMVA